MRQHSGYGHAADVGACRRGSSRDIELAIEGMTCAACAVRIEKKLNRLADVLASVNYATATARVTAPAALPTEELIAAVGGPGTGRPRRPSSRKTGGARTRRAGRTTPGTPPTCGGG